MAEFDLDKKQNKTPSDVVNELKNQYQQEYKKILDKEKNATKKLAKEVGRCKRNKRFLAFRRLFFLLFVLAYMASSLLYAGFATNYYIGLGICAFIALTLMLDILFFILAIFRVMYFKTAIAVSQLMLTLCALVISFVQFALFGIVSYFIVLCTLLIVYILNHAYATTRYTAKSQVLPSLISLAAMVLSALCIIGVIRDEESVAHHDRELYSRFEKYAVFETDEPYASFNGIMLTANDLLSYEDKKIYEIPGTFGDVKVIEVGIDAFRDIKSYNTVVLPESVSSIYTGAFKNSGVQIIEVHSSGIFYIADGFEGSSVRIVRMFTNKASSIVIGSGSNIPEKLTFFVPENLVWDYRLLNPELADRIVALQD